MTRMDSHALTTLVVDAKADKPAAWEGLLVAVTPVLAGLSQKYFLPDGDKDDLRSEALIGLVEAVAHFSGNKETVWAFLTTVMERRVKDAVTRATTLKSKVLTDAVQGGAGADASEDADLGTQLTEGVANGEEIEERIRDRSTLREILHPDNTGRYSELELTVARARLYGETHVEIAARVGGTVKHVDNALLRIRRKIAA